MAVSAVEHRVGVGGPSCGDAEFKLAPMGEEEAAKCEMRGRRIHASRETLAADTVCVRRGELPNQVKIGSILSFQNCLGFNKREQTDGRIRRY